MTCAEQSRQAALDRVGDAYVYGAWDQDCTVKNREKYANLSSTYADAIRNQCQRQRGSKTTCDGCKYQGHRIHDCRGLTDTCAKAAGLKIEGQTVAAQWKADNWTRKDTIDTLPKELPYVQLFRYNGTKWTHTGCYIGNYEVIDARGHTQGVIRSKFSSYKWTHWAIPKGMYENGIPEKDEGRGWSVTEYLAKVKVSSGSLMMRKEPNTRSKIVERLSNGMQLIVLGHFKTTDKDNPDWAFVDEDGTQGYVSMKYIEKVEPEADYQEDPPEDPPGDPSDPDLWGVWIPCENEEQARRYAGDIKNAIVIKRM